MWLELTWSIFYQQYRKGLYEQNYFKIFIDSSINKTKINPNYPVLTQTDLDNYPELIEIIQFKKKS